MMNESKSSESNEPKLSNDPIFVNDEIDRLHRRIFHLRRTNNEIRKHYSDDADCIQALKENVVIIEQKVNALIIYFRLYHQLTAKQHTYTKLYESDIKTKEKLNQHATYDHGDYFYNDSQSKQPRKLKEFDLDYVAQKLREKTKELEAQKKKQNKTNDNDDDDFIADDDGGFTL